MQYQRGKRDYEERSRLRGLVLNWASKGAFESPIESKDSSKETDNDGPAAENEVNGEVLVTGYFNDCPILDIPASNLSRRIMYIHEEDTSTGVVMLATHVIADIHKHEPKRSYCTHRRRRDRESIDRNYPDHEWCDKDFMSKKAAAEARQEPDICLNPGYRPNLRLQLSHGHGIGPLRNPLKAPLFLPSN
jgi:hypothetical protein